MSTFVASAVAFSRGWIRAYTLGLSRQQRAGRLEEIEADMWELRMGDAAVSAPPITTALTILGLVARGMPDDLAWRLEQRRHSSERRSIMGSIRKNGWKLNALWGLTVVFAVFCLASGVGIAIGGEMSVTAKVVFSSGTILAGLLIVAGFATLASRPTMGAALVAAGGVLISLFFWWLFFIVPVVAVVVALFAYSRAKTIRLQRA